MKNNISGLVEMLHKEYKTDKTEITYDLIRQEQLYQTKEIMKNKGYNGFSNSYFHLAAGRLSDRYKNRLEIQESGDLWWISI